MLYANQNNTKVLATPSEKATCPYCDEEVIAKCGDIKIWHWAHKSLKDCDTWAEGETDWHLQWKSHFSPERVEVTMQKDGIKHRADAIAYDGTIIEFQHSYISPAEIEEREKFYGKMIWIFDVKEAYKAGRISLNRAWFPQDSELIVGGKLQFLSWKHSKKNIYHATRRIILDINNTHVFFLSGNGNGNLVDKSRFIYSLKTPNPLVIINNKYAWVA